MKRAAPARGALEGPYRRLVGQVGKKAGRWGAGLAGQGACRPVSKASGALGGPYRKLVKQRGKNAGRLGDGHAGQGACRAV